MEQKVTIEELYTLLSAKLENMKYLVKFYIGKAKDVEKRGHDHEEKDGMPNTVTIAYGDARIISEGEKYLIMKFKDSDKLCKNINIGGGNPNADKLYISYSCDMTKTESIYELNDDDIMWSVKYHLIKKNIYYETI